MRRAVLSLSCVLAAVPVAGLVRNRDPQGAVSRSVGERTQRLARPRALILQEGDGERLVRRPGGPTPASGLVSEFLIKIDKLNGNAQDFYVATEVFTPGAVIPFHKHHNAEEVVILEEGGATVTVGDKRAIAGPRSIAFVPRETWVSLTNTS